jgi:hypothetical protein
MATNAASAEAAAVAEPNPMRSTLLVDATLPAVLSAR